MKRVVGGGSRMEEVRRWVRGRVPEYMVPVQWVEVEGLPVTAQGKVDRGRLPEVEAGGGRAADFIPPRTEVEKRLAEVWMKVLRLERVGVGDNFFELGGDSILSIQIVARARQAGLNLTPKQLFQHQTIAELATVIDSTAAAAEHEQGPVTGALPLTPVQRRFVEQRMPNPNHFNMAVMLEAAEVLNPARLREVVKKLLRHHDALRLRLVRADDGWRQFDAEADDDVPFEYFDLSDRPEDEQARALQTEAARLQSSLNLAAGPLVRVALFHIGGQKPDRLLLVVHHFALDGVSWRILLEDLQTAYQQTGRGLPISLPPKTASFKHWAEHLSAQAGSPSVRAQTSYWLDSRREGVRPLPVDYPGGENTEASAQTVTVALDAAETRALLQSVPPVYHTQITDVLLAALAQTLGHGTGERALLVELEGHGRESVGEEIDVSRTVGWFTSLYPVLLLLEEAETPGAILKTVKEQFRRVPQGGIGYGLLRYLSGEGETVERLRSLPQPEVAFSYHGQFDGLLSEEALLRPSAEPTGPARDPRGERSHLLVVNGLVAGGRLRLDWTYSENLHRRETVEKLAADFIGALRAIIAHCMSPGAGGHTPSDFPLAKLDQRRLDELVGAGSDVEDIYRLSPIQQGILFHTLSDPSSGVYILQVSCTLSGDFDPVAFRSAWQRVIERNTTLRTAVAWKGLAEPLQIVYRHAEVPWQEEDWRALAPDEQQRRLSAALEADLRRGFELARAPLMRLALRRLSDDTFHLAWSFHHILLDGWSLGLLLKQVFQAYAARRKGEEPPPANGRPYSDYIAWLARQDIGRAAEFWRRELKGFDAPTPIDGGKGAAAPGRATRYDKREAKLSTEATKALQTLAQQHQLTLNTIVQGAWALLLSRHSRRDDVLFGTVVSGRPAELAGVESMLGIFINALPLRVAVPREGSLVPWLKGLQERNVEMRQYEYSPLVEVQRWSDVPKGLPLFESVFVFENYPLDESLPEWLGSLGVRGAEFVSQNSFPLTVHAHPKGAELVLQLIYQTQRFDGARVGRMLDGLLALLAHLAAKPSAGLAELREVCDAAGREHEALERTTRGPSGFKKFKGVRPRAVSLSGAALVRTGSVREGEPLPLVVEPKVAGVDAAEWARANLPLINEQLLRHGAILFRGFGLGTVERFEEFVQAITPDLFNENGEHPRRSLSGNVYTPVSYPPEKQLLWHNENSFNHRWPTKIWFGCAKPASRGGETPLADSRRVFELIDPAIRRRFIERQVMYVRNYDEGLGLGWQTVLRTSDRAEAERLCLNNLMEFEWKERDRLRTRCVRPAAVKHPLTGQWVWFNQAQHWHVSCLDVEARAFIEANFGVEDYPRNCYYGDGSPIEDSVMQEILEVYRQTEVSFPWQGGDALVLDNLLTAHGRNAYEGERKLFVALGEMRSYDEVETAPDDSAYARAQGTIA